MDSLKPMFIELKNLLLAKTVALELITNIIGAEDCPQESEDMDCDDVDSEEEVEIDPKNCDLSEDKLQRLRPELEKLLLDHSLPEKVVQHLGSIDDQLKQSLMKNSLGLELINRFVSDIKNNLFFFVLNFLTKKTEFLIESHKSIVSYDCIEKNSILRLFCFTFKRN